MLYRVRMNFFRMFKRWVDANERKTRRLDNYTMEPYVLIGPPYPAISSLIFLF